MGYTVGIISPGDMGSGIGEKLVKNGARVIVALDARSERTKALAAEAGLEDVGSVERLVQEASHVLSVMVPSEAVGAAERVAQALQSTGASPIYADLNAISPGTTKRVGEIVEEAGARFVDGGIIGGPPRGSVNPRIYLSGAERPGPGGAGGARADPPGHRRSGGAGVRPEDVLRLDDEGAPGARDRAAGDGPAAGAGRAPAARRWSRASRRSPVALEVGAGDAAEGAPLDRRDGGDRGRRSRKSG